MERILVKKQLILKRKKISALFFFDFFSSSKSWIRIRIQWSRIHNTAKMSLIDTFFLITTTYRTNCLQFLLFSLTGLLILSLTNGCYCFRHMYLFPKYEDMRKPVSHPLIISYYYFITINHKCRKIRKYKSQQSWVRSQHSPTQWNLRGGRSSVDWITYIKRRRKKSPFKNDEDT